jgi:hypothetical protein
VEQFLEIGPASERLEVFVHGRKYPNRVELGARENLTSSVLVHRGDPLGCDMSDPHLTKLIVN